MRDFVPQPRHRVLVCGKTGSGKTYRAHELLRQWQRSGTRVVVLDPKDEYSRARGGPCAMRVTALELAKKPEVLKLKRLSLAVVPRSREPQDVARAALLLLRIVPELCGRVLLVADEVHLWADSQKGKDCHRAAKLLDVVATVERDRGVALMLVAQRAAHVPVNTRTQLSTIITFRQEDGDDLRALAARTKDRTWLERVARLEAFEALTWRDDAPSDTHQADGAAATTH
jgi:DNA helicase HerA-like ATPase